MSRPLKDKAKELANNLGIPQKEANAIIAQDRYRFEQLK